MLHPCPALPQHHAHRLAHFIQAACHLAVRASPSTPLSVSPPARPPTRPPALQLRSDMVVRGRPVTLWCTLHQGMGARGTPEQGAKVPVDLVMGAARGPGFYFGSDGVRSPLDRYRGPGDPPYTGD